jgi:outer membrane autotransporter protein
MYSLFCVSVGVDVFRLSLKREVVSDLAGQSGRGKRLSANGRTAAVGVMNAAVRLGLVLGLYLVAASPSLAQITQDAYVANQHDGTVSVVDTATQVVSTITLGSTGNGLLGVAVTPDGQRAYVTDQSNNIVSVIDTATHAVVNTIAGGIPGGVAVTPDGLHAYVTNQSDNTVSVIDTATQAVVSTIPVGSNPYGVAVTSNGLHAYVTNNSDNTVSVIDTATHIVISTIHVGCDPFGVTVTPDGLHAYVTNNADNTVSVIDTATQLVINTIDVGNRPYGVTMTPDGLHAYVTNQTDGTVSVIDTAAQAVVSIIPVGSLPFGVAVTPDGLHAYVVNGFGNTVSVIDTATQAVVNTIPVGSNPTSFGNFVGPNLITGTLSVGSEAELTGLGFGQFVDFRGGTLRTLTSLNDAHTISLITPGGTVDTNGFDSTFSGNVIGAGAFTKTGAGTLILTGANTYSGATTISAGTLQAGSTTAFSPNSAFTVNSVLDLNGNSNTVGSLAGNGTVTNNNESAPATLTAGGNDSNTTFSGNLADGAGSLGFTKTGVGTMLLTGANTYSGPTTLSAGTLQAGSTTAFSPNSAFTVNSVLDLNGHSNTIGSLAGTGTVTNADGSAAILTAGGNNSSTTFSGTLADGTSRLGFTKTGVGTMLLTGANTYSGGTSIFPGTLVAAADNALGSGPVQLIAGTLVISAGVRLPNQVNFVAGGVLNNAGMLNNDVLDIPIASETVINSGIINGNVQLGGATDIVQLFTGSQISGNLNLSGTSSSTLILDGSGRQLLSLAVAGTLTNNGSLVKQGSGTWTIDRALGAPLGTEVLAGILVVDAALSTAQINIFTGAVLQLNSGGSVGKLVNDGLLIFSGSGTARHDEAISGSGSVIQDGTGTTILGGTNSYSGGTVINLGTLLVDNPQALGTGDVIVNGGVLGADPQPINVLGNYTQNAGGTLQLNIASRTTGRFDVLNVAGNASLNGTLRLVNQGYQPQTGDRLRLINTGGVVTGRFSQLTNPFTLAAGFNTIDLVYARQSVTLEFLTLNTPLPPGTPIPVVVMTTDFSSFALTPNQLAAASLLDAVQLNPRAANLVAFLNEEPFANLPADFNKISPESLTAFFQIGFSNSNIQRLNLEDRMDEIHQGSNGFSSNMKVNGATVNVDDKAGVDGKSSKGIVEPVLQPEPENRWGVWVTGFGDFVNVDADGNANGYDFTTGGVNLGVDYRLTDQLAIGVLGEYSHTWTTLDPSGHINVDSGRGGVYATWHDHGIYVNGAIYGGYNNYDSSRSGLAGQATGSTEGAEWSTFITCGYDFHFGHLTVGPVVSLQYTNVAIDGFSEQGSLAPLQIHSDSVESLRSDVGFRMLYQWQIGTIIIQPSLKAAWEHEYKYSAIPITAGIAGIPGPSATFYGPSEGHDSAVVSAGVSVQLTRALSIYVNYDGQLGRENYDSNAVAGGIRISF